MRRALSAALAAGLLAACAPVDVPADTEAPPDETRLPGEGLPPRGQPACAPPGESAGIEPPCQPQGAAA